MPKRVIIYIRVSQAHEDMISPETQDLTCRRYLEESGMLAVDVVSDLDLSGGDFAKRKVGQIIARIASGDVDGVVVYRWDRFGRNLEQSLVNLRAIEGIGGLAHSATERFDTRTAAGRFARTNMLGVAQFQREVIGENWMAAHARRLRNGLPHQGTPRFGYWYCDACPMPAPRSLDGRRQCQKRTTCEKCKSGIQIPHPFYGPAFADAWERRAGGVSMTRIVHDFRADGIRTYSGQEFTELTLMQYMDTGFAAGYLRIRPSSTSWMGDLPENVLEETGIGKLDQFIWLPGAHEALTREDTWKAYLDLRRANRNGGGKTRASYPASGLMACVACNPMGTRMRAGGSKSGTRAGGSKSGNAPKSYRTWRCAGIDNGSCNHSNGNRDIVDEIILEWLKRHAKGDEAAELAARKTVQRKQKALPNSQHWIETIARLKKQKGNLIRMRAAEEVGQADFLEQRAEIEGEITEAETKLARTERGTGPTRSVRKVFQGLVDEWGLMPDDLKRKALKAVI